VGAVSDVACLPFVEDVAWIPVEDPSSVGRVRRVVSRLAEQLGFAETRVAELALAATEIGTNLDKHADRGVVLVRSLRASTEFAIEVVAMDRGPGIADVALVRQDGESTSGTLGIGLGAVARLADSCGIASRPGHGTVLAARFHPRRGPLTEIPDDVAGLTRAIDGEEVCGDAYAVRRGTDRLTLMMCDGSGHGPLAAFASQAAVRLFCERESASPEEMVARIHAELRGTRGGAVAVADVDLVARKVRFAGLGNIAGAVLTDTRKQGMISVPGVAGHQAHALRAYDYELPPGAAVVLHSDGLSERWTAGRDDGLLTGSAIVIAMALLRDAGVRKDDACVLVGKPLP
jgi:anti-sigma regulatory factor (Ser/Thr protein kinase)